MKKRITIAGILFAALFIGGFTAQPGQSYPVDSNVVIKDSAGANAASVSAAGALSVSFSAVSTFEVKNESIGPGACSTSAINPSATSSLFIFSASGTAAFNVCPGCSASATQGLYITAGGAIGADNIQITALSACNTGAATSSVSILYGR